MNIDNMNTEELKEYAKSLLDKMNVRQLKLVIIYLDELLQSQEGGN